MTGETAYLCEAGQQGVMILEYRGLDSLAVIPERIGGMPVTALAPYLFSAHQDHSAPSHSGGFWQSGSGPRISSDEALALPQVKGSCLEELRLPSALTQVGAYGFYNCENLRQLELYSATLDWGPGVFTGCSGIEEIKLHVDESRRSCMKEILAEIRQTVRVTYEGARRARLIFPEFFEEAVEHSGQDPGDEHPRVRSDVPERVCQDPVPVCRVRQAVSPCPGSGAGEAGGRAGCGTA